MKIKLSNRTIIRNARLAKDIGFGLRFKKMPGKDEALILDTKTESVIGSIVDMVFVFYEICVVWLDRNKNVVDVKTARPFRFYIPRKKARYVIETNAANTNKFKVGQKISFS